MTKHTKDFAKMTDAQQSDALWARAYKMPTIEKATRRAARLSHALSASDGERLPFCFGNDRCNCLSCPPCRTRGQRNFMFDMLELIKNRGGSEAWRAITIVPEFGKTEVGDLPKGNFRGFGNQVARALRELNPGTVAAFCIDTSWVRTVGQKETWQTHAHGFFLASEMPQLDELRGRFAWRDKSDASCLRPVKVEKLSDPLGWAAYSAKPQFWMREQRPDETGELKYVKKGLNIDQELVFVRALSQFRVTRRFFTIGLKKPK